MFTATEMWVLEWPMAPRGHLLFVVCLTCATLSGWYRHDTCIMLKFEVLSHIHKLWWIKAKQAILRLWNGLIRFIDNSFNPTFRDWEINQMKSPKNVVFKTSIQQRRVNHRLLNSKCNSSIYISIYSYSIYTIECRHHSVATLCWW